MDYIKAHQNSSGGFGYAAATGADSNDTAAAIMALRAAGTPCSWQVMDRGYAYMHSAAALRPRLRADGLLRLRQPVDQLGDAARIKCGLTNGGALSYLADRKRANGSYNYRAGVTQTPAWVTAQVLPAVNGKAYPIRG